MGLRLLALACLVGAAFAGPFQRESQCATRCPTSSNDDKFNYEPGRRYVYDYEGVNYVTVAGQKKQKAHISGQVEIHVKTKCELVLKLKNIRLEHKATHEETADLIRRLELPLPFAFEDGKIDHVCPSSEENNQSQNIKKGILSAIINTMEDLDKSEEVKEVDSLGTCVTKYSVHPGSQIVIDKEKDLKSCTNRHSAITSLMTNEYESSESRIHTVPIFPQEKLNCRQVVENKIIKEVKCNELSTIKPLRHRDGIIEFEGQVKLILSGLAHAQNLRLHSMSVQNPILYNLQDEKSVEDKEHEVQEFLREMCQKNVDTIDMSVSKDFIYLIASVKSLSYESLQRIHSSLENRRLCSSKKLIDLFLDTLPMAGSDGAIKLMVDLLLQDKVSGLKAKLWTISLAMISHPSEEAIAAVVPLIQSKKHSSVLLGVSAMVYRYCSKQQNCENSRPVKEIVSALNEVLGQQCSFDNENEAIAALKAFGNMGQLLHAEQNVLACAKDNDKSIRLRLVAIDAFRRTDKKRPEELLKLYTNTRENYEIRMACLSSVLKYADKQQIRSIKAVAERESDEQVSAYTSTLISNMNKTSSPMKKHVRNLLDEIEINTPKVSYLMNSKNIELSTFNEALNLGGAVEADIIHSPSTKIPRSLYTRFDIDLLDSHMNIFEVGVRAEGLEAAFRKLIGFRQAKKQKSSWSFLQSSNDIEDDKTEASFFFRTMNTEIFDLSVEDLTGYGEMVKIADVLNKMSHDKSADFSHSFMFVNSKLVIPSVTGRSYFFGLTGSATVGLTASSKADIVNIMSKPRNCDIHGHFQPSVNVELAATVGIHTSKPRPDVKIVTRLHSEANIEAQFRIKEGHLGLVKVHMPSENIVLTRVSSDIVEIDAQHQEKPVFENMQKKIDYCFDMLKKPLGMSACAKWEVPSPFFSKTLPFVKGVGNVELSIKKTDVGMKGFELSVEIPKHKSQLMKYKASLDTPGSHVNRRFSADLEVRMQSEEQKQISLEVKTPFRSVRASANGLLTTQRDHIECSVNVQCGSHKQYSIRASSPISESESQKTYRPSIEFSSHSASHPLKIDGTVTVNKGRKEQIMFDLRSDKPSREPIIVKGSIVKEGKLGMSKNAEWKLSSDFDIKTPLVSLQIRKSAEKQSKQAQTILTSFIVDYQKERSQKQSFKLNTKLQQSSSKLSSYAQFETTQFPFANFILTWNMQGKMRETMKNDITLKYGRDMQNQYINVLHSSRLSQSQPSECKILVKAPHLHIDSDLTVTHEYQKNSKLHADVDLRYREDKHHKVKLHLDKLSEKPLKLKLKTEIQTPSKRLMYQDEIEEIASNKYQGNAILEWRLRSDKRAEVKYLYQRLSDRSKFHHEIETNFRMPSSRSIKNKASFQLTSDSCTIENRLSLDRRSEYSLKADLHKKGASYVSLETPKLTGNLKMVNDKQKKSADLDMKLNLFRQPRHIISSVVLSLGSLKKLETQLCLDADRKPDHKLLFSTSFEKKSRSQYTATSKVQLLDKMTFEMSASGVPAFYGVHDVSVHTSLLKFKPVAFLIRHETGPRRINTWIKVLKEQRPKAEIALEGEYSKKNRDVELSTKVSLKSLDNTFETKNYNTRLSLSRSERSTSVKSNWKFEWSPSKIYESEMNSDFQPNMVLIKAYLHTPHIKFEKQSVGLSFRKSNNLIASSATIEFSNGKLISITTETQMSRPISSSLVINTPFDIARNVRMQVMLENQSSLKSLKSHVDINGERKVEAELNMATSSQTTEIKGHIKTVKTAIIPEVVTDISIEHNAHSFKYDVKVMKDSAPLISTMISKQSSHQQLLYTLKSESQSKSHINLKFSREIAGDNTKHLLEAEGPFPAVSVSLQFAPKNKNSVSVDLRACKKSEDQACYSVKAYHKALWNEENYRFYKKLTFDVEKSVANSSPEHVANVNIVASIGQNEFREKFIIETKEKKLGYEFRFHVRDNEDDHCSLDSHIFMPHRTIRIRGSSLYNRKSALLDFEVVPNAAVPSRKLGFELKKESESKEISGYVKMLYPGMRNPIELSGRIQKEGKLQVRGILKLDYSPVSGKSLNLEIHSEQKGKIVTYKLYTEDKSIDISSKLTKHVTRDESLYVHEWTYKTHQESKNGKISFKLSKRQGRPEVLEIEVISPRVTSKVISRIIWGQRVPTGLNMNFVSNNENILEVEAKAEDGCFMIDEKLKSRKLRDFEMCFAKKEGETLQVVLVKSHCLGKPCLTFEFGLDPAHPQLTNLNVQWDKSSYRQVRHEARQMWTELQPRYISDEHVQSLKKMWRTTCDAISRAFNDAKEFIREIANHHGETMKLYLKKVKNYSISSVWERLSDYIHLDYIKSNFIEPFVKTVRCLCEKYIEYFRTHLSEIYRTVWEETKKYLLECMRTYCPRDSFCYELTDVIERFEMERAKKVVSRRLTSWKRSLSQKYEQVKVSGVFEILEKFAKTIRERLDSLYIPLFGERLGSRIVEFVEKVGPVIYKKMTDNLKSFADWIFNAIESADRDEDFRVLKSIMRACKEKAIYAWKNKKVFLQKTWKPMKQAFLKEYPKKLLQDRVIVHKYSPQEGSIRIQIRQPIQRKFIESGLLAIRRKVSKRQ